MAFQAGANYIYGQGANPPRARHSTSTRATSPPTCEVDNSSRRAALARARTHIRPLLAFVLAGQPAGCNDATAACEAAGICDKPLLPAVETAVVCDRTPGAPCTEATLASALPRSL